MPRTSTLPRAMLPLAAATTLAVAASLALPGAAHASDGWRHAAMQWIGHAIASQGNAALRRIRGELADELRRIAPPLPDASAPADAATDRQPDATQGRDA